RRPFTLGSESVHVSNGQPASRQRSFGIFLSRYRTEARGTCRARRRDVARERYPGVAAKCRSALTSRASAESADATSFASETLPCDDEAAFATCAILTWNGPPALVGVPLTVRVGPPNPFVRVSPV